MNTIRNQCLNVGGECVYKKKTEHKTHSNRKENSQCQCPRAQKSSSISVQTLKFNCSPSNMNFSAASADCNIFYYLYHLSQRSSGVTVRNIPEKAGINPRDFIAFIMAFSKSLTRCNLRYKRYHFSHALTEQGRHCSWRIWGRRLGEYESEAPGYWLCHSLLHPVT